MLPKVDLCSVADVSPWQFGKHRENPTFLVARGCRQVAAGSGSATSGACAREDDEIIRDYGAPPQLRDFTIDDAEIIRDYGPPPEPRDYGIVVLKDFSVRPPKTEVQDGKR